MDYRDDPKFRIVVCGYEREYSLPNAWLAWRRKPNAGYPNQGQWTRGRNSERD